MFRIITRAAAVMVAVAGIGFASSAAMAAPACGANCTNATLAVGNTIGTTGFPTSVALSGQAGTTASATATPYSVFSNTGWTLTWSDDGTDILSTGAPGMWHVDSNPLDASFPIGPSTTLGHNGTTYSLPNTSGVQSVLIDTGVATAGGQAFADVYSVAIPSAQAPGSYKADFDYVLSGS